MNPGRSFSLAIVVFCNLPLILLLSVEKMHRPYTVVNWFSAKISKFVATRCNILRLKCTKFDYRWDSAPYPYCRTYMLASTNSKWLCWACSTWAPRSTASTATFCYGDCAQSSASREQYSAGSRHSCKTSGGFRGVRGVRPHPPWRPSEKFRVYQFWK